jgi:uncharacterized protein YbjQ (UPF0145 family)
MNEHIKKQHDYTAQGAMQGVELVVRKGNKYGSALEGEHILVDASELRNTSTRSSCMTLEEYAQTLEEAKKKEFAALEKQAKQSSTKAVVEAELARIAALGAAQEKAKAEAEESKALAEAKEAEEELRKLAEIESKKALKIRKASEKKKNDFDDSDEG